MNFTLAVQPPANIDPETALWLVFYRSQLLVKKSSQTIEIPTWADIQHSAAQVARQHYLGIKDGQHCYAVELSNIQNIPKTLQFYALRELLMDLSDEQFLLAGTALQIIDWDRNHQYCGRCGIEMQTDKFERAKRCPRCRLVNYPRISPAMIVIITRGEQVLLSRSPRFRPGVYSVQAGFVEAGETAEQTVEREVMEEVGLKVKNIRYFGSQPWPFPNSLMLAFTAEYESGELNINHDELEDGGWYHFSQLPKPPAQKSIAWEMLQWFIQQQQP
ncbi:NAD(+) diphosphatase [Candidatus Albibeggiatoa sp. nov. BB20]|uniref:NAD(+) diphosphatase n=1 Tax=Candidatus Albibeggiatoa sp. nov. BB20 TaxID=3162723 RepID=UPI0033658CE1